MSNRTLVLDGSHSYLKRSELLKKKISLSQQQTRVADSNACTGDGTTTALPGIDENSNQNNSYVSRTPSVIFDEVVGDEEWSKIHGRSKNRPSKEVPRVGRSFTEAVREQRVTIEGGKLSLVNASVANIDTVSNTYASRIQTLYMSGNLLRSLQGLEQFAHVTSLSLAGCELSYFDEIRPLHQLTLLEKLSLEGNRVTSIAYYRTRVLSLCPRVSVLDGIKVSTSERTNMVYMSRMVQSQLDLLRTGELKLTVLRHMAGLISCHAQLVATVLGKFRCLRGVHVGMSESFDGSLRIVSHAGEGGRLGDVANTVRIGLSGGVFRYLQLCDEFGCNIFERRVDDICRRLYSAAMRRLPAATKAKDNKALWDDLCGLCAQHHQKQCIALTESCERSREALLCEYNKESVRQSRERPLDIPQVGGAVLSATLNILDRLRFERESYCGLGPHSHAPMAKAEFDRLYKTLIPPSSPPSSPTRRNRSVSPPPRPPPPQTPRTSISPSRHATTVRENRSPNRESVQDRYMTILKSVNRKDATNRKGGVLLSAKKLSFAAQPPAMSPPKQTVRKTVSPDRSKQHANNESIISLNEDDELVIAYDQSFASENTEIIPPTPPKPDNQDIAEEAECDSAHDGWHYLNSSDVLNYISKAFDPLPTSWCESVWHIEDIVPNNWLADTISVSDVLGKPPLAWEPPAISSNASTPKQLQKLVDSASTDLQRTVSNSSTSYVANAELQHRSRLLRKRLVASAAAATRGIEEAKNHIEKERMLKEQAIAWIRDAGPLVSELLAYKDETKRLRDQTAEMSKSTCDIDATTESERNRKVKIAAMLDEVNSAVEGIQLEMQSSPSLCSAARHNRISQAAEHFAASLRSPLIIYLRAFRFRVRRQKKIKLFYLRHMRSRKLRLLRQCFDALAIYTAYSQHLIQAVSWLRKCRTQRWWSRWQQCSRHSRMVTVHHKHTLLKRMHGMFNWWRRSAVLSALERHAEHIKLLKADRLRTSFIFRRWKALRCSHDLSVKYIMTTDPGDHYKARLQYKRFRFNIWKQAACLRHTALADLKHVLQTVRFKDMLSRAWNEWRVTYKACKYWRKRQYKRIMKQFGLVWSRMRRKHRRARRLQQTGGLRNWHLSKAVSTWCKWVQRNVRLHNAAHVVYQKQVRRTLEHRWIDWRSAWIDSWSLRIKMHAAAKLYLRNVAKRHFRAWVDHRLLNESESEKVGSRMRRATLNDIDDSSTDSEDEEIDIRHPTILHLLQRRAVSCWRVRCKRILRMRRLESRIRTRRNLHTKRKLFGDMFSIWCRGAMYRIQGSAKICDGEKEIADMYNTYFILYRLKICSHNTIAQSNAVYREELQVSEKALDDERLSFAEQQISVDTNDAELAALMRNIDETIASIASARDRENELRGEIEAVYALCERGHSDDTNNFAMEAYQNIDEFREEKIRLMEKVEESYRGAVRAAEKQLADRNNIISSTDQAFEVASEAKLLLEALQNELDVLDKQRLSAEDVLADAQRQLAAAIERAENQRMDVDRKEMETKVAETVLTDRLRAAEAEEAELLRAMEELRCKEDEMRKGAKAQRSAVQLAQDDLAFRNFVCRSNSAKNIVSRSLSDLRVVAADSMMQAVRHSVDYSQLLVDDKPSDVAVNANRRQLQQLRMDELNRMHTELPKSVKECPPTPTFSDTSVSDYSAVSTPSDNAINATIQSLSSRIRERLSQPVLMR